MNNMLRVLLVDDEPLARLRLRSLLAETPEPATQVVGEAGDATQALVLLRAEPCDLVLLDIRMPGQSGMQLAAALHALPEPPAVVFITAYAEHALKAFELDAVDYLTKPVRRDRLQAALLRVAQRRTQASPAASAGPVIVVSDRGRVLRLPVAEILYLKAEAKSVTLCTSRGCWTLDEPLADLERRLGQGFLRVHRNGVVALAAVRALARRGPKEAPGDGDEGWQVQLANGDWLAVSRRQLSAVREVLAARP